jgi:peptidoglycan/LPS O-acetylase OafA/YrhL
MYIHNLTPLRGVAALLVAVFHFEGLIGRFISPEQSSFFTKSYLMVDLFFMMSGFIITHVYHAGFANGIQATSFRKFMVARFARVYPLHFFMLALLVAFFYISGSNPQPVFDPAKIPANIFLVHALGVHDYYSWNVPSWSISAEWWSYLLFPFLVGLLVNFRKVAAPVMIVMALSIYVGIAYWFPRADPNHCPTLDVTYDYGFLRGFAGFICGMCLYLPYRNDWLMRFFRRDSVFALSTVVLSLSMHAGLHDLFNIPLFALLILCCAGNTGRIHAMLQNRVLQFLGTISYSVYMTHCLLLFKGADILKIFGLDTKEPFVLTLVCLLFLCATVLISAFTYYVIEKPSRKWIADRYR